MTASTSSAYIGRFAPTPSGYLHFGSLVAALASYLDARAVGGRWLLRMEDLDPPREEPGAQAAILKALESYGFEWDGQMIRQSDRHDAYAEVLNRLFNQGLALPAPARANSWSPITAFTRDCAATSATPRTTPRSVCGYPNWSIASSTGSRASTASTWAGKSGTS